MTPPSPNSHTQTATWLNTHFSFEDLEILCHDLGIDPQNVPGREGGKEAWVYRLLGYAARHGHFDALVQLAQHKRPHVAPLLLDTSQLMPTVSPSTQPDFSQPYPGNPFTSRGMITDPRLFVGREDALERIFSRLEAAQPQSVSIVGERRIGRSSLLWQVKHQAAQRLPNPQQYRLALVDAQDAVAHTPEGFRGLVLRGLFDERTLPNCDAQTFGDVLFARNPTRQKLVVLVDEFESFLRYRDRFGDDFFDGLRALANAGTVTWVTASHTALPEIATANGFVSTFFGLVARVNLSVFDEAEARTLVTRSSPHPLGEAEFALAKRLTAGELHPLKLTLAADAMYRQRKKGKWDEKRIRADYAIDHAQVWPNPPSRKRWLRLAERLGGVTETTLGSAVKVVTWGADRWQFVLLIGVLGLVGLGIYTWDDLKRLFKEIFN